MRVLDLREWGGAPLPANVELRVGSIRDRGVLARAFAGVDRVFHLAGNPNLWAPDPTIFHEVNFEGTCRVLDAAADAGTERIIHTSTESILKNINAPRSSRNAMIDEIVGHTINDVPGPYCRSKFRAEAAALAAAAAGLPVVIVNPTMPVGPGDLLLTPPTKLILGLLNGTIPAYLDYDFNLVDARDAALGHILAAEKGRIGERYILGNENLGMSRLLAELARLSGLSMPRHRIPYWFALAAAMVSEGASNITGKPPLAPITGVRLARSSMGFDCRKARTELGWECRPLAVSIADTISDLRERGLLRRQPVLSAG